MRRVPTWQLPCHSGVTLQVLESDEAIQQIVETLLQIARQRLELVMHSLSDLLERITKVRSLYLTIYHFSNFSKDCRSGFGREHRAGCTAFAALRS